MNQNKYKLYILEWKYKEDSVSRWAKLITFFTRNNTYHDSMFIDPIKYDLKSVGGHLNFDIENNYTIRAHINLDCFLDSKKEIIKYKAIPQMMLDIEQVSKILTWWNNKRPPYSKRKFIFAGLRRLFMPLIWHYYKCIGKPYKPWMDAPGRDYCSTAIDKCLKECVNFDIIPELDENIPYPGLFIKSLERNN